MEKKLKKDLERLYLWKYVKINHLKDEDNRYDGRSGQVEFIDDKGLLHGTWGGLAIIPDVDDFEVRYQVAENEEFVETPLNEEDSKDASTATDASTKKDVTFNDPYSITLPIMKDVEQLVKDCACKVKNGKTKIQIIAKDFNEAIKVIEKLAKANVFKQTLNNDSTQGLCINKISKSSLNDSINEGELPTNKYTGDFLTEFIYAEDEAERLNDTEFDFDEDGNVTGKRILFGDRDKIEFNAAKNHVKYLTQRNIAVDIEPGRYSIKLIIHYRGKQQYDIFKKWLAWHLGYTDVIANNPSRKDAIELDKIIDRGSSNIIF